VALHAGRKQDYKFTGLGQERGKGTNNDEGSNERNGRRA
jgi:hypothetical protein